MLTYWLVEFLQEGVTVGQSFYSEAELNRFLRSTDKTSITVTECTS